MAVLEERRAGLASTTWSLWSTEAGLVVTDPAALKSARSICDRVLAGIDRAANRFDPGSELSRLPDDGSTCTLTPLLADLVAEALSAATATDGAVDPTVGGTLADLGYDRDITLIQHAGGLRARVRRVRGWQVVDLDGDRLTVPPGVRLDLGATAKAGAADRCARAVAGALGCGVLVSLGGDIATAGPGPVRGWQVDVHDVPGDPLDRITLPDGWAVATSSTRRRTWRQGGIARHHLLDPTTGRPARGPWGAATVVARTCLVANTVSTAALTKGAQGRDWLAGTGLPARLVDHEGGTLRLHGWPRP